MSKITLSGNASGTGTLTIASPNTDTDRTLTLPDETGTVITTGSVGAVSEEMLETDVIPVGTSQTWQLVTRTSGVAYTNTTGRTIALSVNSSLNNTTLNITIDGTTFVICKTSAVFDVGFVLIPPGAVYTLSGNISSVRELR